MYHKPVNSLRNQLTHVKDPTPTLQQCGVIYQVDCSHCNETYIGETARPLDTRLKEHKTRTTSAVYEHTQTTGHSFTSQDTKVIGSESHYTKRKVREAIEIKTRRPSLNRDTGLDLPPVYDTVLQVRRTHELHPSLSCQNRATTDTPDDRRRSREAIENSPQ